MPFAADYAKFLQNKSGAGGEQTATTGAKASVQAKTVATANASDTPPMKTSSCLRMQGQEGSAPRKKKTVQFKEDIAEVRIIECTDKELFTRHVYPLWCNNFKEYIKDKHLALVLFHGDMDKQTKAAIKKLNSVAKGSEGHTQVYAHVDCNESMELCKKEQVPETPYLRLYSKAKVVRDYRPPFNLDRIK